DPRVVGRAVRINNRSYRIAGILPESFTGIVPGDDTDLYVPYRQNPEMLMADSWYRPGLTDPMRWWMQLMVRRAPGVTEQQLQALLNTAFAASWVAKPKTAEETPILVLREASRGLGSMRRRFGNPVGVLVGLVAVVLLIACANIANLLLARAVAREK